jgi:hypothetical protein
METMTSDDEGFSYVSDEVIRRQKLVFEQWDALDAKIGIILGFAILVVFQVVLSSDLNGFIGLPPASGAHAALNLVAVGLFLIGLFFLVAAAVVGIRAIWVMNFYETPFTSWWDKFMAGEMEGDEFHGKVIWHLYARLPHNKHQVESKLCGLRIMLSCLLLGVSCYIARFIVILISYRVA